MFINENREAFNTKLDEVQLKKAHAKGAIIKNQNQAKTTKERVQHFLTTGAYTKSNGKVNLTALAKAMNMTGKTVAKYIED